MTGLRTLARLDPAQRRLALRTVLLVAGIRLALWVSPVRTVRQLLAGSGWVPFSVSGDMPVPCLVWAVRAASRRVPMATCLAQSLALQFLLVRAGRSAQVHIGVRKDLRAGFQSHAWVEFAGSPLLSTAGEVEDYSRLLALEDGVA